MSVLFWRRTDLHGLERMTLAVKPDRITAMSTVISVEGGGLRLDHRWVLTPDWRAQSVEIERWDAEGHQALRLPRVGATAWAKRFHASFTSARFSSVFMAYSC